MNKKHDVLIKRIDDILFDRGYKGRETPVSTDELVAIRAALSQSEPVLYVPMTDEDIRKLFAMNLHNLSPEVMIQTIEEIIIRRAIAQGAKLEVQE